MIYGVEYSGELQEQPKTPRHVRELIKLDLACRGKDFSTFPAIQQLFDMPWRVTSTDDIFVQRAIDPEGRTLWPATQQEKKWRPTKAEDD